MIPARFTLGWLSLLAASLVAGGCQKPRESVAPGTVAAKHEHHAPHGGTAIELGEEAYHVELVVDAATGTLQAYVLDGELENFVRIAASELEFEITVQSRVRPIVLKAVASAATGETVGDTSLFEASAEWLKGTPTFEGVLRTITVRGTLFTNVAFTFPSGDDHP